jgi:hypothetical protein
MLRRVKNQRFGGKLRLHHQSDKNRIVRNVNRNVVPTSPILVTLTMVGQSSSETVLLKRATRRNIPEDGILHNPSRKTLKSYIALTGWTL